MLLLNGHQIPVTIFPDKTSQVWKLQEQIVQGHNLIEWRFEHEGEFMHLAQLKALIDATAKSVTDLYIPYLPYGRQDKKVSSDTTFALSPFLRLLNHLDFRTVSVFDPHSSAIPIALLDQFVPISPAKRIREVIEEVKPDTVLYPDTGAALRYANEVDFPYIQASKSRDATTGKITGVSISGEVTGKSILIVDDICDGGATFIGLAGVIKDAAAISLYVSHGIFSKGLDVLRQSGIQRIFTKDGEIK